MKILSIDTSCDETAAAVTEDTNILSNIVWSQASAHTKYGGIMPSLAKRMHEERIDWVIHKAVKNAELTIDHLDAIAVTVGPGLSIALGVGVDAARSLAINYDKKLIAVNHLEGHVLSPLANSKAPASDINFPSLGLVVSGGNTLLVKINKIGSYEIVAQTTDDALGEALDKAARMLGLGYPGGAILEKFARGGNLEAYRLPIPIVGQEERKIFTYSGLKTSFSRLVESEKPLTKEKIINLASCFQDVAFTHLIRITSFVILDSKFHFQSLLVGGGVSANLELRKRLRKLGKYTGINVLFPYSKKLTGDNAAMIGVAAYFKALRGEFIDVDKIDRKPSAKISD
ncbi:MAG: putative tRNA threonylcarbamoyladenosine biosynthesis protein Gcp [Microgenomates group bacterium GW2011_GWC1_43_13]|uniref:tRNA N6-adenosine threonylcarbamoyltransferase n=3 Tax=Candidatus Woeseibacteriota TaxID=1752722 RepID=A0A837I9K8_9BACT|nr:MAG: putative tRNA threonylcarbamoyladenosine biosynthesis protein Gcp [Microgenomates group bacterium GW2011_GWC1_43_13]KKT33335.1 MAG: putative tRNA threonylcarbamoyladenosine biosynthesis protein Gcp [Candidatus Woesebacteria bacterium GW2011_GWB1_44_11]KKT54619.1 MAG: putative tRNA threonylcarbamoyladenosine biosynthesis protein Gcp [Candidatus Woesebacteria bacterium GW2011_GWA1_44_23]OGM76882.1 MAG: tRNA (adenosine(37)-N6)-threonylcarbamoyltransferase complex transferase subunit TsaD [C